MSPAERTPVLEHLEWVRRVVREHLLDPATAHVLLALAGYADDRGECWPGLAQLATDSGRSERQIAAALAELVQLGLIERHDRGRGRTTLTRLLDPGPTSGAEQRSRPALYLVEAHGGQRRDWT